MAHNLRRPPQKDRTQLLLEAVIALDQHLHRHFIEQRQQMNRIERAICRLSTPKGTTTEETLAAFQPIADKLSEVG